MAVARKFVEQDQSPPTPMESQASFGKPKPALALADHKSAPSTSPARMLQAELQRALSPGPVAPDRFSKRRAMKFIAPACAGFGLFITLVNHIGHH